MTESPENRRFDEPYPSELRCPVFGEGQFQLPAVLVNEVGFQSALTDPVQGAKVAWYYHEEDDKAVLAANAVDRSSLELKGATSLSDIDKDDLESGDPPGAQIRIVTGLPDHLHKRLTRDSVVLKPLYEDQHSSLRHTCVSVYPALEYDSGMLPNVDSDPLREGDNANNAGGKSEPVGNTSSHANSV